MNNNELTLLPVSFGQLKSLQTLKLWENKLSTLPESFGKLESLQELYLNYNKLTALPEPIFELKSLQTLSLKGNWLITLPGPLWQLQNLTTLDLSNNPWEGDSKEMATRKIPTIREYCRKIATIHLFISHVEKEFHKYRIEALAEYLGSQTEIYPEVFYSEKYMVGDMDESMEQNIQESQILLFIASRASVLESEARQFELATARKFGKEIIPLRGDNISWRELEEQGLAEVKGLTIDLEHFDQFCTDIYEYIKKYKREINLFEKEQAKIDKKIRQLKESLLELIDSQEFKEHIKEHPETIKAVQNYFKKFK